PFAKKGTPRSGKLLKAPGTVLRGPALDVDRDGYDDLVVYAGGGTARSSLVLGGPTGPAQTGVLFPAGDRLALGRFGKGKAMDAAIGAGSGLALRYDVPGTARAALKGSSTGLRAGDFDGDGLSELVVVAQELKVYQGRTQGLSASALMAPPAGLAGARVVEVADLDGDKRDDLVVQLGKGEGKDEVAVYPGTKGGIARKASVTFSTAAFVQPG
ncbi:VCBS repeat-containing protein, partial [Streptomyces sp. T-3]|nr:VCBS repeat-containing protein [Streptomyces sp. T-3]